MGDHVRATILTGAALGGTAGLAASSMCLYRPKDQSPCPQAPASAKIVATAIGAGAGALSFGVPAWLAHDRGYAPSTIGVAFGGINAGLGLLQGRPLVPSLVGGAVTGGIVYGIAYVNKPTHGHRAAGGATGGPSRRHVYERTSHHITDPYMAPLERCARCGGHRGGRSAGRGPVACHPTPQWLRDHPEDDRGLARGGRTRRAA